jgi:hypothetical protein
MGGCVPASCQSQRDDPSQWTLEGPRDEITEFGHKPGMFKAFCARCGSPLHARSSQDPDDIRIRLGGFEGSLEVAITAHVWTSSKSTWYAIEDSLPRYPEAMPHDLDA